jgi:hypothetical protein
MCSSRKYWGAFSAVNFAGGAMVLLGGANSVAIWLFGLLMLLPGSVLSGFLPYRALWHPFLWRCCGITELGMYDTLYLPYVFIVNMLSAWAFRVYKSRRATRANTLNPCGAAGDGKTGS